jgi:hypothetical protein
MEYQQHFFLEDIRMKMFSTLHLSHFYATFKFKQALAKHHQMITDIYVMESILYLFPQMF